LSHFEKQEVLENWVIDIEVQNDYLYNPLIKKRAELEEELNIRNHTEVFFAFPYPRNDNISNNSNDSSIIREAIYHTQDLGDMNGKVLMPDYQVPLFSEELATEVARLIALLRIKREREIRRDHG
jgi:hypothetical protein